jgi:hypothetical protein
MTLENISIIALNRTERKNFYRKRMPCLSAGQPDVLFTNPLRAAHFSINSHAFSYLSTNPSA